MRKGNYDDQVLGTQNPLHPANQVETDIELTLEEQLFEEIAELEARINLMRNAVTYRKAVNAKIIEIIKGAYATDYEYLHNKLDELL